MAVDEFISQLTDNITLPQGHRVRLVALESFKQSALAMPNADLKVGDFTLFLITRRRT